MTIQSELLALKDKRELLTAEDVVDWARAHPRSALYKAPEFCGWDPKKSAHEHWLWGARKLMAIHVVYEDGGRRLVSLSLDRSREGGGYRDINDVLRDESLHEIMLQDALRELQRMEEKYQRLKALKPIWTAAAKVRRRKAGKAGRGVAKPGMVAPSAA
jgi:hypothetical protein